jgi:oligopeptide transport system substrate-binding protein
MRNPLIPILIIFVLILFGCQRESSKEPLQEKKPLYGQTFRNPLDFEPRTLDPHKSTDIYSVTLIQQLFDGLVRFDKELNIVPAIAQSWKVSHDGLVYTFSLREGVKFHNGREVTAEDFVYSFNRIVDPTVGSSVASFFNKISGMSEFANGRASSLSGLKATGRYELEITLIEPYTPFITLLAMKGSKVIPKEEVERGGVDFGKHPVGTGPFKFVRWESGKEIVLEAFNDYYDGRPFLDTIEYRVFAGAKYDEMFYAFSQGDLEKTTIPATKRNDIIQTKRYRVIRRPSLSLLYYGLNTKVKPLDNEKVRQAINLAIDKERIIAEAMKKKDVKAISVLPPGMPGYSSHEDVYPFSPERAKALLTEAGFPDGKGLPVLEVWSASTTEATMQELEIIKDNLSAVGIIIDIKYEDNWPTYAGYLNERKLPIFRYVWYADFPDPDNFLSILFHSKTKYNFASYSNPETDYLMEEAKKEIDALKRAELYRKAEMTVLKDAPLIPILHRTYEEIYQPYVKGIEVSALGAPYIPMKKLWLDKKELNR